MITLRVNGQSRSVAAKPDTPLLYVLRNELGLYAAKLGCGLEQCGSCTVLVDGEARMSCRLPIASVVDAEITTLEGIGTPKHLHPLQRAFYDNFAAQCGYCSAGMITVAKALLDHNPHPTRDQIVAALSGNVCRCTGYVPIINAIESVANGD